MRGAYASLSKKKKKKRKWTGGMCLPVVFKIKISQKMAFFNNKIFIILKIFDSIATSENKTNNYCLFLLWWIEPKIFECKSIFWLILNLKTTGRHMPPAYFLFFFLFFKREAYASLIFSTGGHVPSALSFFGDMGLPVGGHGLPVGILCLLLVFQGARSQTLLTYRLQVDESAIYPD